LKPDENGKVIKTETEIDIDQLPEIALTYINENYPGYELEEVEKIESAKGTFLEVEIEHETDEEIELLFDFNGKFIEVQEEEEEEED